MNDDFGSAILSSLLYFFVFGAVLYVYFAICLATIARKTGTPNTWMAWIPLLNMLLVCRVAKKPGWWILLLLVPLINIAVGIVLWMEVARARGKSPVLGVLILVPLVNLVVPAMLAAGDSSSPNAPPQPGRTTSSATPQVCPACGRAECIGDEFCGYTGQRIAGAAVAAASPAGSGVDAKPGVLAKVILGVILVAAVGYFSIGLLSSGKRMLAGGGGAGAGTAAGGRLPQRMAGAMTEFPVDTAATPARPTSVTARNLRAPSKANVAKLPAKSLPPGVTEAALPRIADSMTTATYQTRPTDPPVSVHVLSSDGGSGPQSQRVAEDVRQSSGAAASVTGVRVASPTGAEYTGYRVRTPETVTYVLDKTNAPIVIIIYAADPSVKETADRLAANVGNGNGLADYAEVNESIATLPQQLPGGLELAEMTTYSGDTLKGSLDQLRGDFNRDFGAEAAGWIDQVKSVVPPQLMKARYVDSSRRDVNLVLGTYGGSMRAWATWLFLRATLGLAGMRSVAINGGDAMSATEGNEEYVLFRRGARLGFIAGPAADRRNVQLAEAVVR